MPIGVNIGYVVPYIGKWIETETWSRTANLDAVVPYIGTWIETCIPSKARAPAWVVPYIGTWIETQCLQETGANQKSYLI